MLLRKMMAILLEFHIKMVFGIFTFLLSSCVPIKNNDINPLNAKLNPVCHLLALLGAHHIFHVSRIRVKPGTFQNHT
jgi:hypothetical protein